MRATLEIDLSVIAENYRHASRVYGGPVHAVLKRDAYQMGLRRIGPLLARAGCRGFFVETLPEARALKAALLRVGLWPREIYVLTGLGPHHPRDFAETGVFPLLSSRAELSLAAACPELEVGLILETGFGRPGLHPADLEVAAPELARLKIRHVMSHLAEMNAPDAPRNQTQRAAFLRMVAGFPEAGISLGSSAFLFAGEGWRIGAARVGSAILGTRHVEDPAYHTRAAVRMLAPVLGVTAHEAGAVLGYGGVRLNRASRIASLALGYADGLPEAFWQKTPQVEIAGRLCPLLADLSMMQCFADVTDLPANAVTPGTEAEIFGTRVDLNDFARSLGLKPNYLLTRIGGLCQRRYVNRPEDADGPATAA